MKFEYTPINNYDNDFQNDEKSFEFSQFLTPKQPTTEEEYLNSRRKCARCKNYYTNATNGECKYHTGQFSKYY